MSHESSLKQKYQLAYTIHLAMLGSLAVYTLLIEIFSGQLNSLILAEQKETLLNARYLFYGIAILVVLAIRWVRQFFLRKTAPAQEQASGSLLTMSTLTSALCEVPVLLGLVLYILNGYKPDFYFLLIISLILFVMYLPRIQRWREWQQASERKLT